MIENFNISRRVIGNKITGASSDRPSYFKSKNATGAIYCTSSFHDAADITDCTNEEIAKILDKLHSTTSDRFFIFDMIYNVTASEIPDELLEIEKHVHQHKALTRLDSYEKDILGVKSIEIYLETKYK